MRTTSAVLISSALLLAACGDDDLPAGGTTDPVSETTVPAADGLGRFAVKRPSSIAELDGVVVRYHESPGEGPGFDLRFHDDGTVEYEFLANDRLPFTTASSTHDVAGLTTLIDGIEPADLATGADDCNRPADGSAPQLAVTEFEVDYCYTNPADHPLIELVRSTRARLQADLDELNASGPDDATGGIPAPVDFEGVSARYSMPGGECDRCDLFRRRHGIDRSTIDPASVPRLRHEPNALVAAWQPRHRCAPHS